MPEPVQNDMPEFAPTDGVMIKPLCSVESEQMILGAVMTWPDCWERVVGAVREGDFFRKDHRMIFSAMASLASSNGGLDCVAVGEFLERAGESVTTGGFTYLATVANNTPNAANVGHYARTVRDYAVRRQVIRDANEIIEKAHGSDALADIVNEAQSRFMTISSESQANDPLAARELLAGVLQDIEDRADRGDGITGLPTGWVDLDNKLGGLQGGDLIIVAGRPSMGKTTFAMNIAEHCAISEQKTALVFSIEMPGKRILNRCLSSVGSIPLSRIRSGKLWDDDYPRLTDASAKLSQSQLVIDDTGSINANELSAKARRISRENDLGLIVIDYLQLMPGKGENRNHEISGITRALKALAKELDVPIVLLSQLSRDLERRPNKRPAMSDLRDSGAIEQDADVIIFPYRDEVYDEHTAERGVAEIGIAKNRDGETGVVKLVFQGQFVRFVNYAQEILPLPLERPVREKPYAKKGLG